MWTWARRRRARPAAGLAALSLTLLATGAPLSAKAQEVIATREVFVDLALEVRLNGVPRNLISNFRATSAGRLIGATLSELAEIGFDPRRLKPSADGLVHLDAVPGLRFRYDEANQAIDLLAPPELLATTRVDARPMPRATGTSESPAGAVVNYTLFGAGGASGGGVAFEGASAALDARVFGRFGVVSTSAIASVGPQVASGVVRLDTTWRYEQPDKLMSYAVGDVITRGPSWSRSVRLGGAQVSRSFELRPDLITAPTPVISGTAATPSTLDLYVNNVKQLSTNVPAGPFQIDRAPLSYGAGMAQVVVRDALGRDTRVDLPFYASEALLAKGLVDFSVEAGVARRNFGLLSDDYDRRLAFSGSARAGVTSSLTLEGHGEAGGGLVNAGGGAVFGLGRWAVASGAVAVSRDDGRMGALFDASIESRQRFFTLSFRMQRTLGDYQDLASLTAVRAPAALSSSIAAVAVGDPLYAAAFKAPRALDQAVISVPVWTDRTRLSISYARIVREDDRVRLLSVSLTHQFKSASLYVRALQDFDHPSAATISVGISLPLGRGVYASAEAASTDKGASVVAEAASRTTDEPGSAGWRVRLGEGTVSDRLLSGSYVTQLGRAEAGVQQIDGRTSGYGQFAGGFAFVSGQPFLSRRLDGPFALVDAGAKGLPVRFENRLVGVTGASGKLLVPNLVAYQPNRISVDPTSLPLDQEVATDTAMVAPRSGAAALVRLGWTASASAVVVLADEAGRPLDAGALVRLDGAAGEGFFVGYDGEAYVSGLSTGRHQLTVTAADGTVCRASFDYRPKRGEQVRLGPVACRLDAAAQSLAAARAAGSAGR